MQELWARLPPQLQENSEPGKALNKWLLQLMTLRTPELLPQNSGQQSLKSQLIQLQIALPSDMLLNDKRGQAQLQSLAKETFQLLTRIAQPLVVAPPPIGERKLTPDTQVSSSGDQGGKAPSPTHLRLARYHARPSREVN